MTDRELFIEKKKLICHKLFHTPLRQRNSQTFFYGAIVLQTLSLYVVFQIKKETNKRFANILKCNALSE